MNRRGFITLLGGAMATWPLAVRAQQSALPIVGFVSGTPPSSTIIAAIRKGLSESGYVEGRNVAIQLSISEQYEGLPALAAELVRRRVAVIFAAGAANAALAAKAATSTIPIVFATGGDPVRLGLVSSLSRPGGNLTGVTFFAGALVAKQLELLRELVPGVAKIGYLANPANVISEGNLADAIATARSVGQELLVLSASTADEIDNALETGAREGIGALLVAPDNFFTIRRSQFAVLTARYRIPAIFNNRLFVDVGGLMSYTDDRLESSRLAGVYAGRILKGDKPADLPVLQPTKFEFVINIRTAKALSIAFPASFHVRADEVIE
jgi:putative ABC transport system substrate-binding protein